MGRSPTIGPATSDPYPHNAVSGRMSTPSDDASGDPFGNRHGAKIPQIGIDGGRPAAHSSAVPERADLCGYEGPSRTEVWAACVVRSDV